MQASPDIEALLDVPRAQGKNGKKQPLPIRFELFKRRVTEQDLVDFSVQLSVMLESRISLQRVLEILVHQTKKERMKRVLEKLSSDVAKGNSFARALSLQSDVFDNLFCVTSEVGEQSGRLALVMANLARHTEKMAALKRKFTQALVYPAMVLSVAVGAVLFLLLFIVPTFAEMFKSFQVELPLSTRVILEASRLLSAFGPYVLGSLIILIVLLRGILRSRKVKEQLDRWMYHVPFFGEILVRNLVARFCRTLGTLLEAQVSLVDALSVTQRIFTTKDLEEEIQRIIHAVRQGRAISEPITGSKIFPPMVSQMIAVGEETSELDRMLLKVAEYYEQEIDAKIEMLSTVIEPVIILFLGAVVSMILIAMYMPMFELMNVID